MGMAVLTTGCLVERPFDRTPNIESQSNTDPPRPYKPIRSAIEGKLQGVVGPVAGLDHDASLLSAYDDGYYLSVETVVQLQDRAVMTLLSISNGEDIFQPGLDATFTLDNYDSDGVQVTMLGCVGQDVGVYDEYDQPADDVHVTVDEGDTSDDLLVSLTANWYDRDDQSGERLSTSRTAHTQFTLLR